MTTGQPAGSHLIFGLDETQYGIRVKCPKVAVGPLELGISATYNVSDADDEDGASMLSFERLKPSLTVKEIFLRGKFELDPKDRKLTYSKKLRLPFLNTDLFKLQLSAQWPSCEGARGLLGRALGVNLSFQPEALCTKSVVRKAPEYALDLSPRVGPPQRVYDDIGFPGSVYFKAKSTLHLSDAASVRGLRARLDLHSLNVVLRLYDPDRVKPSRVGRNLAHAARRLTLEDAEAEEEARRVETAVKVARVLEASQPEPDVIDQAAAKAREWAHAVLVNSCVATRHLQDTAAAAAERVRSVLGGGGGGSNGAPAAADASSSPAAST